MDVDVKAPFSKYHEMDDLVCPQLAVALVNAWKELSLPATLWIRTTTSNHMDVFAHSMTMPNVKLTKVSPCHNELSIFTLTKSN